MNDKLLELVAESLMEVLEEKKLAVNTVPIGISARHLHLTREHIDILFGAGHTLTPIKPLSQPNQYACEETVAVIGPKNSFQKVRVLGPPRKETQVELSMSDAKKMGLTVPVRSSGKLDGTPGVILRTEKGEVTLSRGVIIADRHLHMSPAQSTCFGFEDGDIIQACIDGAKGGIMGHITVRVHPEYELDLHVDTDDANAFDLKQGQHVYVEKSSL